jgi:SAGA-associated factor 29
MIPIIPKHLEPRTIFLALYPDTTTFYKAEVRRMSTLGYVHLIFEGEVDPAIYHNVERRFVIEYRP